MVFSYSYTFWNISLNNETQFGVKAHYIVQKMLSQGNFCKILKFVINCVIKYNWLGWNKIQHYNVICNIVILYEFHGYFLNKYNIMDFQRSTQKSIIIHNQWI